MLSENPDHAGNAGPAFVLVLPNRMDPEYLAGVLLVGANDSGGGAHAVVALDDDGDLVAEVHDLGSGSGQAELPRQKKAQVFVLGVAVEAESAGLEDVGRGRSTGGDASALAFA